MKSSWLLRFVFWYLISEASKHYIVFILSVTQNAGDYLSKDAEGHWKRLESSTMPLPESGGT